jgi:hypothetical protein
MIGEPALTRGSWPGCAGIGAQGTAADNPDEQWLRCWT